MHVQSVRALCVAEKHLGTLRTFDETTTQQLTSLESIVEKTLPKPPEETT
jgi:hypothetical protein